MILISSASCFSNIYEIIFLSLTEAVKIFSYNKMIIRKVKLNIFVNRTLLKEDSPSDKGLKAQFNIARHPTAVMQKVQLFLIYLPTYFDSYYS